MSSGGEHLFQSRLRAFGRSENRPWRKVQTNHLSVDDQRLGAPRALCSRAFPVFPGEAEWVERTTGFGAFISGLLENAAQAFSIHVRVCKRGAFSRLLA